MAILWTDKVLLVAAETVYGTPAVAAGADAILAMDVRVQPMEGQDTSRGLERPHMGAQETIPTGVHARLTFSVEILPSGTAGTAPVIGRLLRGCGCAQVIVASDSVTYNPISLGHESVTIRLWIGNTLFALAGARGTARLRLEAQGVPRMEFEFTGLWTEPTQAAALVPTLAAQMTAEVLAASAANTPVFTLNGTACVMRSFTFALGNRVEPRLLVNGESIRIVDRAETVETTIEALPLTTLNPFSLAGSRAGVAIVLQHGTAAGRRVTLTVPRAQMQRLAGLEESQGIMEWPLRLVPLAISGNDQWTLAFT